MNGVLTGFIEQMPAIVPERLHGDLQCVTDDISNPSNGDEGGLGSGNGKETSSNWHGLE